MFTLRIVCEEVLDHYGSPIKEFLASEDMLWYIKPKSYEIVCVEPVYESKIVRWKKTSPIEGLKQP